MEEIICNECKTPNRPGSKFCDNCGTGFSSTATQQEEDITPGELESTLLPKAIKTFAIIYFILSIVGAIILFLNSKDNYYFIAVGIAELLIAIILTLICFGIARVIEQNIYIMDTGDTLYENKK